MSEAAHTQPALTPSKRSDVAPFYAMQVLAEAQRRAETHGDVISLCVGQPSTGAPAAARAAAHAAIDADGLGYTEALGIKPLREAIAVYHRELGVDDVTADDVVVTTGSSGGFTLLFLATLDVGDTVVMSRPGYPAYRNTLQALGANVVELATGPAERYQISAHALERHRADHGTPRAVVVASPANPTGTIIEPDELAAIARWCDTHGVLLISDEIYHGISFGPTTASAWQFSRNAVVIGSVSKYFSMTGWRLGWMLVPPALRPRLDILASNLTICPPAVSQHAALGAFTPQARAELDAHVATYARNRDLTLAALARVGVTDVAPADGAFYAWCDISHLTHDTTAWCAQLLAATGVAITPGVDFDPVDGHRFIRISLAVGTDELAEALNRVEKFIAGEAF